LPTPTVAPACPRGRLQPAPPAATPACPAGPGSSADPGATHFQVGVAGWPLPSLASSLAGGQHGSREGHEGDGRATGGAEAGPPGHLGQLPRHGRFRHPRCGERPGVLPGAVLERAARAVADLGRLSSPEPVRRSQAGRSDPQGCGERGRSGRRAAGGRGRAAGGRGSDSRSAGRRVADRPAAKDDPAGPPNLAPHRRTVRELHAALHPAGSWQPARLPGQPARRGGAASDGNDAGRQLHGQPDRLRLEHLLLPPGEHRSDPGRLQPGPPAPSRRPAGAQGPTIRRRPCERRLRRVRSGAASRQFSSSEAERREPWPTQLSRFAAAACAV
jgi:hypothetical protein